MAYTSPSITTSGTTFAELQARGLPGLLEALVTSNLAASANPSAPTLSATGGGSTGGSLPAGAIYVKVTESDGCGETLPSSEVNVTIASGNIPQVTFAALKSGNVSRNVYVGIATGAEVLYATGVTASTYNMSAAVPTNSYAVAPPTVNSTGILSDSSPVKMRAIRAPEKGNLQEDYNKLRTLVSAFISGRPVNFQYFIQHLRDFHTALAILSQACAEIGTLVDSNPGTIKPTVTGPTTPSTVRSWP